MRRSSALPFLGMLGILVLGAALTGCGRSGLDPDLSAEQKHIHHAVQLAGQYAQATKKQPTSIDEVKNWAVKEGKGSADDFSSTRDKEPYVIVAGQTGIILHEQNGKGGKCYLYRMGQVSEIKKDEVADAIKNAQSMGRPAGATMGQRAPRGGQIGPK